LSFVSRVWIRELYIHVLPTRLPSLTASASSLGAGQHESWFPFLFPLVFRLAPTHLGWDTQRQFTRRSRDPPGVETPTPPMWWGQALLLAQSSRPRLGRVMAWSHIQLFYHATKSSRVGTVLLYSSKGYPSFQVPTKMNSGLGMIVGMRKRMVVLVILSLFPIYMVKRGRY
jgi:hypothetical protein